MPCTESAWPSHQSRTPPERRRKGHRQQRLEGGNTPWGDPFGLALLDPSTLELSECGLDAEHESGYGVQVTYESLCGTCYLAESGGALG